MSRKAAKAAKGEGDEEPGASASKPAKAGKAAKAEGPSSKAAGKETVESMSPERRAIWEQRRAERLKARKSGAGKAKE